MTQEDSSRVWPWLIGVLILISTGLGGLALTDPDESRYATVAREMLRSGDRVVPTYNGEPRLNKPPLLTWLQAVCFRLAGIGEVTARLPSLAAGVATLALVAWWARRRLGKDSGGPVIAVLATTVIFFVCARLAILDMLLACGIAATLLFWREAIVETDPLRRRFLATASSLSCGLATLAKGPVGFLLPAFVIVLTTAWGGREKTKDPPVTWRGLLLGFSGLLLVTGPWVWSLAARIGWGGLAEILDQEVWQRTVAGLDHTRPWYYFLLTFWPAFLPWSLALPLTLFRSLRVRNGVDPQTRFLVCWLAGVIVFFSIPADKNDAYLLPAAPALALLTTRFLSRKAVSLAALVTGLLLGALCLGLTGHLSGERSLKGLVKAAGLADRDDYELIGYRMERPSLVFYADHRADWVRSGNGLKERLVRIPAERSVVVVMTRPRLLGLPSHRAALLTRFSPIAESAGYVVLLREGGAP